MRNVPPGTRTMCLGRASGLVCSADRPIVRPVLGIRIPSGESPREVTGSTPDPATRGDVMGVALTLRPASGDGDGPNHGRRRRGLEHWPGAVLAMAAETTAPLGRHGPRSPLLLRQ